MLHVLLREDSAAAPSHKYATNVVAAAAAALGCYDAVFQEHGQWWLHFWCALAPSD